MRSPSSPRGFSLIEVLVAIAVLSVALVSLVGLFTAAAGVTALARDTTFATLLASRKVEELRALAFTYDSAGRPVTDTDTDTGLWPPGTAGAGLQPAAGTLAANVPGYVDHLDGFGRQVGGGAQPPGQARYTRRWQVMPLPDDPSGTLVVHVVVLPSRLARVARAPQAGPGIVHLVALRARKAS